MDRLRAAWQEAVFALYLAERKVEPTSPKTSVIYSSAYVQLK